MMPVHKFRSFLLIAITSSFCSIIIQENVATAASAEPPPMVASEKQATELSSAAAVKALQNSTGKSLTSAANPIELLLEEISQLKLDLVPDSLQQAGKVATRNLAAAAASEPKQIRERATSNSSDQQQLPVAKLLHAEVKKPVVRHERQLSVCDKSLAIGTLGYRMLCPQHKLSATPLSAGNAPILGFQSSTEAAISQEELVRRSEAMNFVTPTQLQVITTTTPTSRSEELKRLKLLLDKLIRNGNFRPHSSDSAPEVR